MKKKIQEKRSDDYSKNGLKVRVYMYLLPFGFEKADLLLGEFFNTDAVAEVSLESRERRKNREEQ